MAVQQSTRLFTVEEYERMVEVGILTENDRVELVEGNITEMAAKGNRHAGCVRRINALFFRKVGSSAIVSVQDLVRVGERSELEPDIALLRPREDFYASAHPLPDDVLLLVEVSDTTLSYDHGLKLALYAAASIREVWIVNLVDEIVEMYALPKSGKYQETKEARRGEMVEAGGVPGLVVGVDDILGDVVA